MKNRKLLWRMSGFFLISALFFGFGNSLRAQDTWEKVSAATELTAGDEVIIVAGTKAFNGDAGSWGGTVDVTVSSDKISTSVGTSDADKNNPRSFIVEFDDTNLSLRDKWNNKYLQGSSSGNVINYSENSVKVTLTTKGIHDVDNNANLRLNGTSGFRFYRNDGTTGNATELYKKQAAVVPTTPFVNTAKTEVSYKIQPTENLSETLSFTAGNLEADLTVSVASATEGKAAVISVDKSTVSKETTSFDLTLTTSNLPEGEYSDIIT
ncbi:MAG: hypothetical protein K2I66_00595, partial [Bacteroidales bacterium]|nr:hypothetical protein [Bacteroidales bacterium]